MCLLWFVLCLAGCGGSGTEGVVNGVYTGACPWIAPSERTLADDAYDETCGKGCDPIFALLLDESDSDRSTASFVSCAPAEVPLPDLYKVQRGCLVGPADGEPYYFRSARYRARMIELGWKRCLEPASKFYPRPTGCGDSEGEGPYTAESLGEDPDGCPILKPEPCSGTLGEYHDLCGDQCRAVFAPSADQDAYPWFVGCRIDEPYGCPDIDWDYPFCLHDPFDLHTYEVGHCAWLPMPECWSSCWAESNSSTEPRPDYCP